MYEWDEAKREINLELHELDFADAWLVYESPSKITIDVRRSGEERGYRTSRWWSCKALS